MEDADYFALLHDQKKINMNSPLSLLLSTINLKCVIFDMDGVLYDSMKTHEMSWVKSLKRHGIEFPPEEAYLNEGRTGKETIKYAFNKYLNQEISIEEIEKIYSYKTEIVTQSPQAPILPKIKEFISLLRRDKIEIWVVTGSKQPSLLSKLENDFNINPNHVISAKDVLIGKPDPEPYLMALKNSGFKANEALVIENAPLGVRSAKGANIKTIAVNTGILDDSILTNEGADIVLSGTEELYDLWSKVF